MPTLYLAPPTADPIDIDPAPAAYYYVIPTEYASSISFTKVAGLQVSLNPSNTGFGRVLSVQWVGKAPPTPQVRSLNIQAHAAGGVINQTLNFRCGLPQISKTSTQINCTTTFSGGVGTFKFSGPVSLRVDDAVADKFGQISYVVAVDQVAGTFQLSATHGGDPATATFSYTPDHFFACTSVNQYPNMWVGDTSALMIGQGVALSFDFPTGVGLEADPYYGYVVDILDQFHIRLSATPGGAPKKPTVDAYTRNNVLVLEAGGVRRFPNITSAFEFQSAPNSAFNYAITTDIGADSFSASGLPPGLTLSGASITGTLPNSDGWFAVLLTATLAGNSYSRYLEITVGTGGPPQGGGGPGGGGPGGGGGTFGVGPVINASKIYYDGDFTVATQVGQPIFDVPFPADPKEYLCRITYWQFRANFAPLALDAPGPYGGVHVGEVQGQFFDIGGGIIQFQREFAIIPPGRNEFESYVYGYQLWQWKKDNGVFSASINEIPITTHSRVQLDYFHTPDPTSVVLGKAPRAILDSGVWATYLYFANGYDSIQPGQEMLAEDATLKVWKGNIYERKQRWIVAQTFGQAV